MLIPRTSTAEVMANTNSSKLMELTLQISSITKTIILELEHAGATEPDFSSTSTEVPSTPAYNQLRDSLNDAAQDLLLLVNGPMTHARTFLCTHHDLAAYQIAFEFGFFQAVPTSGKISLSSLAKAVKLDVNIVSRVMYFLCTQRVFNEVDKGEFQHTHGSIVFAREEGLRSAAEYQLDEFFRAAGSTAVALKKGTSNPFVETFGMPLFQYYGQNPKLGARFASAMGGIVKCTWFPPIQLRKRITDSLLKWIVTLRNYYMVDFHGISLRERSLSILAEEADMSVSRSQR
jgi:hypothetical protein